MNKNQQKNGLPKIFTLLLLAGLICSISSALALNTWDQYYVYLYDDDSTLSLAEGITATFDSATNTGTTVTFVKSGYVHALSLDSVNITFNKFFTDNSLTFTTETDLLGTITLTTDWGPPNTVTNAEDSYNALTKTLTLQVIDGKQVTLQWPNTLPSSALADTYSIIYMSLPLLGLLALAVIGSVTFMFIMNRNGNISYISMAIVTMVIVIIGVAIASAIMSAIQTSGVVP